MDVNLFSYKWISILVILTISACSKYSSSEEDCSTYDYADCDTYEPINAKLEVYISSKYNNNKTAIKIYNGYVDQGSIYKIDTVYGNFYSFYAEFGTYYSVEVEYNMNGKKIIAIDGGKPVKKSTIKCDSTCWETRIPHFDLTIK